LDFRNDIFGPYDGEIFLFFSFAFLSIFVCATSGTNVNAIRRIDFKNFRYPWDAIAITSHMRTFVR
jgi:hypothetical protein